VTYIAGLHVHDAVVRSTNPISKKVTYVVANTWLKAFGWKVDGEVPEVRKAVVIAAPHTSNWDLPFTLAVSWKLGFSMSWLGKHTLFKGLQGKFFRATGGIPVDRSRRSDMVANAVEVIEQHDDLFLIVAPEGTRSKTERWKTGFYHMAVGANVPIVLGYLDYKSKRGGLGTLFWPTGDIEADMKKIRAFYAAIEGKHPTRMSATTVGQTQPVSIDQSSRDAATMSSAVDTTASAAWQSHAIKAH
jgi:1-acyl-sn-glycerol-3-phosphate acyltransferase